MRDLLAKIIGWQQAHKRVATATVVKTWGSAPRPLGSKMAITADGEMAGSVSGGCVEGAVFEEAQAVLGGGEARLVGFGVTNEQAWEVGLSCGGEIEIFVESLGPIFEELRRNIEADGLVALATVVAGAGVGKHLLLWPGGQVQGDLGLPRLNQRVALFAEQLWTTQNCGRKTLSGDGADVDVFFDVHPPSPRLIIVGAVHAAIPLIAMAKILGFRTVVVDPRSAFATDERFGSADELLQEWPQKALPTLGLDEGTYLTVLSHDFKIDLPALETAMRSRVRYIGALGSRKTHAKRVAALEESGFSRQEIERIHSPIGFDLGGRRAEEIAIAIMAEIVAARHGRTGRAEDGV